MLYCLFFTHFCRQNTIRLITIFVSKHSVTQSTYVCQTGHLLYNSTFTYYSMNAFTPCTVMLYTFTYVTSIIVFLLVESCSSNCCNLNDKRINSCATKKKTIVMIKAMKVVVELCRRLTHAVTTFHNARIHSGYHVHVVSMYTLVCINNFTDLN